MTKGAAALITIMLAILVATGLLAYQGWTAASDVEISTHGYIAMGLGVFFSFNGSFWTVRVLMLMPSAFMAWMYFTSRRQWRLSATR